MVARTRFFPIFVAPYHRLGFWLGRGFLTEALAFAVNFYYLSRVYELDHLGRDAGPTGRTTKTPAGDRGRPFLLVVNFFAKYLCVSKNLYICSVQVTKPKTPKAMQHTHRSYSAAHAALRRNKKSGSTSVVTWDAGNGWTAYGCYNGSRIVTWSVSPEGVQIF